MISYDCQECVKKDWPRHKKECGLWSGIMEGLGELEEALEEGGARAP